MFSTVQQDRILFWAHLSKLYCRPKRPSAQFSTRSVISFKLDHFVLFFVNVVTHTHRQKDADHQKAQTTHIIAPHKAIKDLQSHRRYHQKESQLFCVHSGFKLIKSSRSFIFQNSFDKLSLKGYETQTKKNLYPLFA